MDRYYINGFVKVDKLVGGGLVGVSLWNPETHEYKHVITDDYEYQYGDGPNVNGGEFTFAERDYMSHEMYFFADSKEIEKAYEDWRYEEALKAGRILKGMTVEVFKGRKYPIGTTGVVKEFYDYKDRYGRAQTRYIVTTDGKRIPMENCKPIA